jgi:protein-S-isoprenylcysteine O-methyltransferase Ste14
MKHSAITPASMDLRGRQIVSVWLWRLVPVAYFTGLGYWEWTALDWDQPAATAISGLSLAYITIIIASYLRRGLFAQAVAILGANLLIPLSYLPSSIFRLEPLIVVTDFAGIALSLWAVWHLGTAFSLAPEARHLVQTGPYRWIRHPLYAAGFVIAFGLLVVKLSPAAIGLFLGFVITQGLRIAYEEQLLSETWPEYKEYQQHTWMIVPFIL